MINDKYLGIVGTKQHLKSMLWWQEMNRAVEKHMKDWDLHIGETELGPGVQLRLLSSLTPTRLPNFIRFVATLEA